MAYITNDVLMTSVAARLGVHPPTRLVQDAPQWVDIIETANEEAYNTIRTALVGRGFALADIDAWDRGAEFNRKIGLCLALREGAMYRSDSLNDKAVDRICECIEELDTIPILVDDIQVDPQGSADRIGYGDKEREDDVFTADMET